MNLVEKELAKKRAEEIGGLSKEEIYNIDKHDALAKELHLQFFPEEYDYMMDSLLDSKERRQRKNPMTAEYVEQVNNRRREFGISPLATNGLPTDNRSWEYAKREARRRLS
ncbi:MAG: hypothetical protein R3213_13305 [Flavobacteriaceae bacterium]|nr:hypothetical protein [Flavobacteriaceae bacterium]